MSKDTLNYDDLTESQKRKVKEFALSKGYRIEGITDDEIKEFFRSILTRNEELRKKLNY